MVLRASVSAFMQGQKKRVLLQPHPTLAGSFETLAHETIYHLKSRVRPVILQASEGSQEHSTVVYFVFLTAAKWGWLPRRIGLLPLCLGRVARTKTGFRNGSGAVR